MTPEQFREFAKLLPEPLLLLSGEGRILASNSSATDLFGLRDEELIGKPLSEFAVDPPEKLFQYLRACSRTSQRIINTLNLRTADQKVSRMRSEGSVVKPWSNESPSHIFLRLRPSDSESNSFLALNKKIDQLAREIRQRRLVEREREEMLAREQEARREAELASRAKDDFLATLSHELRTPLNAILGWASMLRTRKVNDELALQAAETIERNAKSQAKLIEDMLDVSRIITGQLRLDVRPVDLTSVIQAAVDVVRPTVEVKGIRLQVVLDPNAGPIAGDPNRLQQIVWNLLSNAVKFTPKRGRIQVRLERINSHVQLTVSDTGQGISPDFLPLVFDRFKQADSTLSRAHGGLGLGLAIVRHLVEQHGGTVRAESSGEGQGATFKVQLPVIIAHGAVGTVSKALEWGGLDLEESPVFDCPPTLRGLRLLVIEDDPDARELVSTILKQCEAEVKAVGSASEAFEVLEEWGPDLLVSDIEMPEEDGYSLIRRIRSSNIKKARIPAVALTAHARTEDRVRALSVGFQSHVTKPVDPAELIAVIASLTKHRE
ncbi:MAG TPA: ATP-binding protein [Blastocatellia bacterium]|nr:ATP-binding protein [Blastocatellia bacterium]